MILNAEYKEKETINFNQKYIILKGIYFSFIENKLELAELFQTYCVHVDRQSYHFGNDFRS